jgi:hypothetical protein
VKACKLDTDMSSYTYWVFRAHTDSTSILPSELPMTELRHLPRKMPPQAYQNTQHVVPRGGIFLCKWRSCHRKFRLLNECPISLRSEHPIYIYTRMPRAVKEVYRTKWGTSSVSDYLLQNCVTEISLITEQ